MGSVNILAIDTSGKSVSCGVMKDGVMRAAMYANSGLTHSETLMPSIDDALERAGIGIRDVDLIACVTGPGSFTGVRIGVCAAKGLAHPGSIPCLPVDSLEAIAWNLRMSDAVVCPMLDARRHEVYAAAFRCGKGCVTRLLDDSAEPLDAFLDKLPGDAALIFAGDGSLSYREQVVQRFPEALFAPENLNWPESGAICEIARENAGRAVSGSELCALYLRAPQAVREKEARNG